MFLRFLFVIVSSLFALTSASLSQIVLLNGLTLSANLTIAVSIIVFAGLIAQTLRRRRESKQPNPWILRVLAVLILFFLATLISGFQTEYPQVSLQIILSTWILFGVPTWVREWEVALATPIILSHAILYFLFTLTFILGILLQPISCAQCVGLSSVIAIFFGITALATVNHWSLWLMIFVLSIGLGVAGSRAAFLALLVGITIVALASRTTRSGVSMFQGKLVLLFSATVIPGFLGLLIGPESRKLSRLASADVQIPGLQVPPGLDLMFSSVKLPESNGRLAVWNLLLSQDNAISLLGSGTGSASMFTRNLNPEQKALFHHPHSEFLRILFDNGVLGLSLFVIIILFFCFALFFGRVNLHKAPIAIGLVVALGVMSFFDNPLVSPYLLVPCALLLGLLAQFVEPDRGQPVKNQPSSA